MNKFIIILCLFFTTLVQFAKGQISYSYSASCKSSNNTGQPSKFDLRELIDTGYYSGNFSSGCYLSNINLSLRLKTNYSFSSDIPENFIHSLQDSILDTQVTFSQLIRNGNIYAELEYLSDSSNISNNGLSYFSEFYRFKVDSILVSGTELYLTFQLDSNINFSTLKQLTSDSLLFRFNGLKRKNNNDFTVFSLLYGQGSGTSYQIGFSEYCPTIDAVILGCKQQEVLEPIVSPSLLIQPCSTLFCFSDVTLTSPFPNISGFELEWYYYDYVESNSTSSSSSLEFNGQTYRFNESAFNTDKFIHKVKVFASSGEFSYRIPLLKTGSVLVCRTRSYINEPGYTRYSDWVSNLVKDSTSEASLKFRILSPSFVPFETHRNLEISRSAAVDFTDNSGEKFMFSFSDGFGKVIETKLLESNGSIPDSNNILISHPIYDIFERQVGQLLPFAVKSSHNDYSDLLGRNEKVRSNNGLNEEFTSLHLLGSVNSSGLCEIPRVDFSTTFGSAQYYSPLSSYRNSFPYVVDASQGSFKSSPYTLSGFTFDKTGRKRFDMFPSPDSNSIGQMNSYYYSTVHQEELDKYFGHDAGYARFYSKQISKDPNGLYSISIKDAKGNVVISSLGGIIDSSSYLPLSNDSLDDQELLKVTLQNDEIEGFLGYKLSLDGLTRLSNFPIVFTNVQSRVLFDYGFSSSNFNYKPSDCVQEVCLPCEYEFNLKFVDECGNFRYQFPDGDNFVHSFRSTIDSCNGIINYSLTLPQIENVDQGSYYIQKALRINDSTLLANVNLFKNHLDSVFCVDLFPIVPEDECIDTLIGSLVGLMPFIDSLRSYGSLQPYIDDMAPRGQYGALSCSDIKKQFNGSNEELDVVLNNELSIYKYDNAIFRYNSNPKLFNLQGSGLISGGGVASWRSPDYYLNFSDSTSNISKDSAFSNYTEKQFNYLDELGRIAYGSVVLVKKNDVWVSKDSVDSHIESSFYSHKFKSEIDSAVLQCSSCPEITIKVPVKYLPSPKEFAKLWKPSFGLSLIKYHPEYFYIQYNPILARVDELIKELNKSNYINNELNPLDSSYQLASSEIGTLSYSNTDNFRFIPKIDNSGFELRYRSRTSLTYQELFKYLFNNVSSVLELDSSLFMNSFSRIRYIESQGNTVLKKIDNFVLERLENINDPLSCSGTLDNQLIGEDNSANFLFLRSVYIKQLEAIKEKLIISLAIKSKNKSIACITKKKLLNSEVEPPSPLAKCVSCDFDLLSRSFGGSLKQAGSDSCLELPYYVPEARGTLLSNVDDELGNLLSCESGSNSTGDVTFAVTDSTSVSSILANLSNMNGDAFCEEYINSLFPILENRANVAYFKNCGQCPSVRRAEELLDYLISNTSDSAIDCYHLGKFSQNLRTNLKQFFEVSSIINTYQVTNSDLINGNVLFNLSITSSSKIGKIIVRLDDSGVSYTFRDLLRDNKISDVCCFKATSTSDTSFTAQIKIKIDSSDPYYILEDSLKEQYRMLNISGSINFISLNECNLSCNPTKTKEKISFDRFIRNLNLLKNSFTSINQFASCGFSLLESLYSPGLIGSILDQTYIVCDSIENKHYGYYDLPLYDFLLREGNYILNNTKVHSVSNIENSTGYEVAVLFSDLSKYLYSVGNKVYGNAGPGFFGTGNSIPNSLNNLQWSFLKKLRISIGLDKLSDTIGSVGSAIDSRFKYLRIYYPYYIAKDKELESEKQLEIFISNVLQASGNILFEIHVPTDYDFAGNGFVSSEHPVTSDSKFPCCNKVSRMNTTVQRAQGTVSIVSSDLSCCFAPDLFVYESASRCVEQNNQYPFGITFCSSPNVPLGEGVDECGYPIQKNNFQYYVAGITSCENCSTYPISTLDLGAKNLLGFLPSDDDSPTVTAFPKEATSLEFITRTKLYSSSLNPFVNELKVAVSHALLFNDTLYKEVIRRENRSSFVISNGLSTSRRLFVHPSDWYKLRCILPTDKLVLLDLEFVNGSKNNLKLSIRNGNIFYDLIVVLSEGSNFNFVVDDWFTNSLSTFEGSGGSISLLQGLSNFFNTSNTVIEQGILAQKKGIDWFNDPINQNIYEISLRSTSDSLFGIKGASKVSFRNASFNYDWNDLHQIILPASGNFPTFYNVADGNTYFYLDGIYRISYDSSATIDIKSRITCKINTRLDVVIASSSFRFIESSNLCCPAIDYIKPIEVENLACQELTNESSIRNNQFIRSQVIETELVKFKKLYLEHCMAQKEKLQMTFDSKQYQTTLYYYDQAGNLVRTIPPQGIKPLDSVKIDQVSIERKTGKKTVFTEHNFLSTYKYNSLNKKILESNPDQDNLNLISYSDNSNISIRLATNQSIDDISIVSPQQAIISSTTEGTSVIGSNLFTSSNQGESWERVNLTDEISISGSTKFTIPNTVPYYGTLVYGKKGYLAFFKTSTGFGDLAVLPFENNENIVSIRQVSSSLIPNDLGLTNFDNSAIMLIEGDKGDFYSLCLSLDTVLGNVNSRWVKLRNFTNNKNQGNIFKSNFQLSQSDLRSIYHVDDKLLLSDTNSIINNSNRIYTGRLGSSITASCVAFDDFNFSIGTSRGGIYTYNSVSNVLDLNPNFTADKKIVNIDLLQLRSPFICYQLQLDEPISMYSSQLSRVDFDNLAEVPTEILSNSSLISDSLLFSSADNNRRDRYIFTEGRVNTASGLKKFLQIELKSLGQLSKNTLKRIDYKDIVENGSVSKIAIAPISDETFIICFQQGSTIRYFFYNGKNNTLFPKIDTTLSPKTMVGYIGQSSYLVKDTYGIFAFLGDSLSVLAVSGNDLDNIQCYSTTSDCFKFKRVPFVGEEGNLSSVYSINIVGNRLLNSKIIIKKFNFSSLRGEVFDPVVYNRDSSFFYKAEIPYLRILTGNARVSFTNMYLKVIKNSIFYDSKLTPYFSVGSGFINQGFEFKTRSDNSALIFNKDRNIFLYFNQNGDFIDLSNKFSIGNKVISLSGSSINYISGDSEPVDDSVKTVASFTLKNGYYGYFALNNIDTASDKRIKNSIFIERVTFPEGQTKELIAGPISKFEDSEGRSSFNLHFSAGNSVFRRIQSDRGLLCSSSSVEQRFSIDTLSSNIKNLFKLSSPFVPAGEFAFSTENSSVGLISLPDFVCTDTVYPTISLELNTNRYSDASDLKLTSFTACIIDSSVNGAGIKPLYFFGLNNNQAKFTLSSGIQRFEAGSLGSKIVATAKLLGNTGAIVLPTLSYESPSNIRKSFALYTSSVNGQIWTKKSIVESDSANFQPALLNANTLNPVICNFEEDRSIVFLNKGFIDISDFQSQTPTGKYFTYSGVNSNFVLSEVHYLGNGEFILVGMLSSNNNVVVYKLALIGASHQNTTTYTSNSFKSPSSSALTTGNTLYLLGTNASGSQILKKLTLSNLAFFSATDLPLPGLSGSNISIKFIDDYVGYVLVNKYYTAPPSTESPVNGTSIFKTVDGGLSWTLLNSSFGSDIHQSVNSKQAKAFDISNSGNILLGAANGNVLPIIDHSNKYTARYFYDEVGRLVLSQNAKQFNKTSMADRAYSYMLYDGLGRVYESGEIKFPITTTNKGQVSAKAIETGIITASELNYLHNVTPEANKAYQVKTFYDVPNIPLKLNLKEFTQENLLNRVSCTVSKQKFTDFTSSNSSDDKYVTTITRYSYDAAGNVKETDVTYQYQLPGLSNLELSNNYTLSYVFDELTGKVFSVCYNKGKLGQFYHKYAYNAEGKLLEVFTSVDNTNWNKEAKYIYYPHGPLARVELGANNVQGLDYYYTLQGWLKGVNSGSLKPEDDPGKDGLALSTFAPDVVGYNLNYYKGDFNPINSATRADLQGISVLSSGSGANKKGFRNLYNGNIAAMVTSVADENKKSARIGIYQYDELNRIKTTQNKLVAASIDSDLPSLTTGIKPWDINAPFNETFDYDRNGNILSLTRKDEKGATMDSLLYNYLASPKAASLPSNRLGKVTDSKDKSDFDDFRPGQIDSNYAYDACGNLVKDSQEGLAKIIWTPSNKMEFLEKKISDTKSIYNYRIYDGTGQLVLKWRTEKSGSIEKPLDGEEYVSDPQGNPMAIYRIDAQGRRTLVEQNIYGSARIGSHKPNLTIPVNDSISSSPLAGKRSYEITNHLGNVLAVIDENKDDNGRAVVLDKQDYYAFGSPLPNKNQVVEQAISESFIIDEKISENLTNWVNHSNLSIVWPTVSSYNNGIPHGTTVRRVISNLIPDQKYRITLVLDKDTFNRGNKSLRVIDIIRGDFLTTFFKETILDNGTLVITMDFKATNSSVLFTYVSNQVRRNNHLSQFKLQKTSDNTLNSPVVQLSKSKNHPILKSLESGVTLKEDNDFGPSLLSYQPVSPNAPQTAIFNLTLTSNSTYKIEFEIDWKNVVCSESEKTIQYAYGTGSEFNYVALPKFVIGNKKVEYEFKTQNEVKQLRFKFGCSGATIYNVKYSTLQPQLIFKDDFGAVNGLTANEAFEKLNYESTTSACRFVDTLGRKYLKLPNQSNNKLTKYVRGLIPGKTYTISVVVGHFPDSLVYQSQGLSTCDATNNANAVNKKYPINHSSSAIPYIIYNEDNNEAFMSMGGSYTANVTGRTAIDPNTINSKRRPFAEGYPNHYYHEYFSTFTATSSNIQIVYTGAEYEPTLVCGSFRRFEKVGGRYLKEISLTQELTTDPKPEVLDYQNFILENPDWIIGQNIPFKRNYPATGTKKAYELQGNVALQGWFRNYVVGKRYRLQFTVLDTAYQSLKNLFIIKENTTGSIMEFLYNETPRLANGTREISLDFTALTTSARLSINPFVGNKLYIQSFRIIQLPDAPAITPPAELVSTGIILPVLATPTGANMNLSVGTANSTIVSLTDTAKTLIFKPRIIPQAQYQLQFDIQWPAGSTQQQRTMQLQGISVAELNTNFTEGANTATVNFVGGAIDGSLKLTFGLQGVTIRNIKYTVEGSPVVMADSARTIKDNYSASDTLWSRTVVNGNLVLAPNNSTAACTLSRQFTGLVVGRTYRLLIAVPNSGAPTTGTFANIVAEGSTTPMFTIEANLAWQTITTSNYNTNAPRSGYSQVNGTGIKEYYLIFKATTSTITINYLGAKQTSITSLGRSLRHIKLIQEPVFEGYPEEIEMNLASNYRYGFNTQQKQDDIYGPGNQNTALYWEYDTRLGRRWNLDPVEFPYLSRYATLNNNPFGNNDILGDKFNPIYNTDGDFLGTDDKGLQGEPIVMAENDFKQGMSNEEALRKRTDPKNDAARDKIFIHSVFLSQRPDYDGYVTDDEARKWYKFGNGQPLFVDRSKIDLKGINTSRWKGLVGDKKLGINMFFNGENHDTRFVYGGLNITLLATDGTVMIGEFNGLVDNYSFERHKGEYLRNAYTALAKRWVGKGKSFDFYGYGYGKIEKE